MERPDQGREGDDREEPPRVHLRRVGQDGGGGAGAPIGGLPAQSSVPLGNMDF